MILVNGQPESRINISDRGLQYGDGVFETIAYRDGIAEFQDAHLARLKVGCERLSIPFKQFEQLKSELISVCRDLETNDTVIKIIITRGSGGRGYFADPIVEPTRIISSHPYPDYPETHSTAGVALRFCEQTLSENKFLAGIKHLNRLEQVLARNEWDSTDIVEGLMFDNSGNIIEGTMSNLFFVKSGQLHTPQLTTSGIAGIIRAQVIVLAAEMGILVKECVVSTQELLAADEVFICNSLIGIWPVCRITDTNYSVGKITKSLQQALVKAK